MSRNWSRHARQSPERSAARNGSWPFRAAAGRPRSRGSNRTCALTCAKSRSDAVIVPIGFLSDHMEVIYDLDVEARRVANELGIRIARAGTVGTHPAMIEMIAQNSCTRSTSLCAPDCCARRDGQRLKSGNNPAIQLPLGDAPRLGDALDGVHAREDPALRAGALRLRLPKDFPPEAWIRPSPARSAR